MRHVPLAAQSRRRAAPLLASLAAAVLLAGLLLAPLGSLAQDFITIFAPQQFAAVPITRDDLYASRGLPDLGAFGVVHAPATAPLRTVADRRSAAALAGMVVRVPGPLPAGVPGGVRYMVMPRSPASFTFSATKARDTAARGGALPPMPPHLDGTTLRLDAGPAVLSLFGAAPGSGAFGTPPMVAIVQAHAPVVGSTGVPVRTVEDYLLRLPGVSPHLAAEIRAIGDPTTTLPLPVPLDFAAARSVPVHGARGLLVGDSTELGSGVIWQRDGMVYGVIGTLPAEQILAIALSLHP